MKPLKLFGAVLAGLLAIGTVPEAGAQTIDDRKSCESIRGSWIGANPPQRENRPVQRYGRCSLRQVYEVPRNTTLTIAIGVELAVSYGGRLTNNGHIDIPDTAALIVVGGTFFNNGSLYADNSGEVWFFLGRFDNTGDMTIEGDLFTEPMGTRTPQSPTACLNNSGSVTMFSGGNVHSRGCIDSIAGGTFDVLQTATFNNYNGAHYRSGPNDSIGGRFNTHWNSYTEIAGRVTVDSTGIVDNAGQMRIVRDRLTLNAGATMVTPRFGSLTFAGGDMLIHGTYTSRGGVTTALGDGLSDDQLELSQSGRFDVEFGSTVWESGRINIINEGTILLDCIVFWYPPMSMTGYLMRKYCRPTPIIPPRRPFQIPSF